MTHRPPKWPLKFLNWFCPEPLVEAIEGDLCQQFEEEVRQRGLRKARFRFVIHFLKFFRPSIILRNKFTVQLINSIMVSNYFKVAARNIRKQKLYSFINAVGLSVGIAFCVLIYLYIEDERSFDQFHANKDFIYRVEEKSYDTWQHDPNEPYRFSAWLQTALGPTMKADLAEVENYFRFNTDDEAVFRYKDKVLTEKIGYTDPGFFKMLSFKLISGNPDKLFQSKTDAVITPAIAAKYFGDKDPIGESITLDVEGEKPFVIAGIIEAPPANSSFNFQILVPQENRPYYERNSNNWGNFNTPTFVQLAPNTNMDVLKSNMAKFVEKHMGEKLKQWRERSTVAIPDDVIMLEYPFTKLTDMHLNTKVQWHKASDPRYSMILGAIAILILSIACINYISLALTTSAARRTEVGIRKVVGAQKSQIIYQFGIESVVLCLISMVIGLGLVALLLPSFNSFTTKGIELLAGDWLKLLGVTTLIAVTVGILAGSYPAFFLSAFRPALVLKGGFISRVRAGFTRPLVVLQFALSSFLIICSVIMYRQMEFITTKDLGYDQNQVIVIPTQKGWNTEATQTVAQFRARLEQEPDVVSVGGTSVSFNRGYSRYGYRIEGEQKAAYVYTIDPQYIPTLDIELTLGRNFDQSITGDTTALIVNEALVRDMKWTDPLNSYLNWQEDTVTRGARIIGVVKDYHFRSLESGIEPMILTIDLEYSGHLATMLVKVKPDNIPGSVERLRTIWKEMYPDRPFDFTFLDEDVAKQYRSYQRWMGIMEMSTGFAILISCLGLFGLSGINAVNRTKEIGIRKVMGADLSTIFVLLNRPFVVLSLIAFAIAAPASWYVITKLFLKDFEYKVPVGWELFAVSVVAGLAMALLTVSYHAVRAAMTNPAETLKYE